MHGLALTDTAGGSVRSCLDLVPGRIGPLPQRVDQRGCLLIGHAAGGISVVLWIIILPHKAVHAGIAAAPANRICDLAGRENVVPKRQLAAGVQNRTKLLPECLNGGVHGTLAARGRAPRMTLMMIIMTPRAAITPPNTRPILNRARCHKDASGRTREGSGPR